MPLRLLSEVSARAAADQLDRTADEARRAYEGSFDTVLDHYAQWITYAVSGLRLCLRPAEVDRLVATRRFDLATQLLASGHGDVRQMIHDELRAREDDLRAAAISLRAQATRFDGVDWIVIADANVFLHHPAPFDEIPWRTFVPARSMERVMLVVPLLVVDEIDRRKTDTKKRESDGVPIRTRARVVLRALNGLFPHADQGRVVMVPDEPPEVLQTGVWAALWVDDPSVPRLADADSELVDQAVQVRSISGTEVVLASYDTGIDLRGRTAGVRTHNLTLTAEG